jgi:hypothetical protein
MQTHVTCQMLTASEGMVVPMKFLLDDSITEGRRGVTRRDDPVFIDLVARLGQARLCHKFPGLFSPASRAGPLALQLRIAKIWLWSQSG